MAKQLLSGLTSEEVDQYHNATKNLRYWPASTALAEASAPIEIQAVTDGGTDLSSDDGMTLF